MVRWVVLQSATWVAHPLDKWAAWAARVVRWVVWHPAEHLALTRLGCKWVAWVVPLAAQWVALRVGQWVAPVPVRWLVAWARPLAKWAAWA